MSRENGAPQPPNLVGQEVFDEVRSQLQHPRLDHLFDYSLDTNQARSFWPESDAYRRDTVMVFGAVGKAMLLALELSESSSRPFHDGSVLAPLAFWTARFVVGLPPAASSYDDVTALGDIAYGDVLRGSRTRHYSGGNSSCTAEYRYWQLPGNRNTPLEPTVLTQAVKGLGGLERDDSEPNLWTSAQPQFSEPAARLAHLVAPSGFHDAARELTQPPFIHHLAAKTGSA